MKVVELTKMEALALMRLHFATIAATQDRDGFIAELRRTHSVPLNYGVDIVNGRFLAPPRPRKENAKQTDNVGES